MGKTIKQGMSLTDISYNEIDLTNNSFELHVLFDYPQSEMTIKAKKIF